jgi:hypothetical protein
MVFVVSGVFILALALAAVTIIGTLIGSMPQISNAIAGRNGPVREPRIIHVGAVRQTGHRSVAAAQILNFKPRLAAAADGFINLADDLPLAA